MASLLQGLDSDEPSRKGTLVEDERVEDLEAGIVEDPAQEPSEMAWEVCARLDRIEHLVRKSSQELELAVATEPLVLSEEQFAALMAAVHEKLNEVRGPEHTRAALVHVEPGQMELDQDRKRMLKRFIWLKAAGRILTYLSGSLLAVGIYMSMVIYNAVLALSLAAPLATMVNLAGSVLVAVGLATTSSLATSRFARWLDDEVEQEKKRLLTEQAREEQRFQKLLEE